MNSYSFVRLKASLGFRGISKTKLGTPNYMRETQMYVLLLQSLTKNGEQNLYRRDSNHPTGAAGVVRLST